MTKLLDLNLNFSTNKNTIVRINRKFTGCVIFFSNLSRNYNEYMNSEFPESKEYKTTNFALCSEDSYLKSYNKKLAGEFSFYEFVKEKYSDCTLILKRDILLSLASSIENNGKDYINNLIFGVTIDAKFLNIMDFKKKKGIGSIPLRNFTISFKIGEDKDEY